MSREGPADGLRERLPRIAAMAARALGWTPDTFWIATPAELAMWLSDPDTPGMAAMSRADLDTMMERLSDG